MSANGNKIRAGEAYVELSLEDEKLTQGIPAVEERLKRLGSVVSGIGAAITGVGASLLSTLSAALGVAVNMASKLAGSSSRTGIAIESLSELGYVAEQSNVSVSALESGIQRMQTTITDAALGSESAAEGIQAIGLSVDGLQRLNPEEQFRTIVDHLSRLDNHSNKAAMALKIFGQAGADLMPIINGGSAAIDKLRKQARDLGVVLSKEDVTALAKLSNIFGDLWKVTKVGVFQIGAALAPAFAALVPVIADVSARITTITGSVLTWMKNNRQLAITVAMVAVAVAGIGVALLATGTVLTAIGHAIVYIGPVFAALGTALAFLTTPIGLVASALVLGTVAWAKWTESGKIAMAGISEVLGTFRKTFGGVVEALLSGQLKIAGKIAMAGLKLAFLQGVAAISDTVGGAFGQMFGTVMQQLGGGDFAGAWGTIVQSMGAVWDQFVGGIVSTFVQAANAIVNVWKQTTKAITDFILSDASQGGLLGQAALLGTGVDMQTEQGKAEATRLQSVWTKQRLLDKANQDLAASEANGGTFTNQAGLTNTSEELRILVENLTQDLANAGVAVNTLADAQKIAAGQIDSAADAMQSGLERLQADAQARADQAAKALADQGVKGVGDEQLAAAKKELDAAFSELAKANKKQADDMANLGKAALNASNNLNKMGNRIQGTFSAELASRLGVGGTNYAAKTADNTAQALRWQRAIEANTRRLANRKGGIPVGQGTGF